MIIIVILCLRTIIIDILCLFCCSVVNCFVFVNLILFLFSANEFCDAFFNTFYKNDSYIRIMLHFSWNNFTYYLYIKKNNDNNLAMVENPANIEEVG